MRRLFAAFFDVIFGLFLYFCFIFILFFINEGLVNEKGNDALLLLGFSAVYFLVITEYPRIDIGKRVFRVKLNYEDSKPEFKIYHVFFKMVCCIVWPISIIYIGIKENMPYDKFLGITEVKIQKNKRESDGYLKRRLIALLIDLVCLFIALSLVLAVCISLKVMINYSIVRIFVLSGNLVFWIVVCVIPQADIGKKIAGIVIKYETNNKQLRICHALLKSIGVFIWPITGVIVMITGGVPYDKWLKIEYEKKGNR